ncbi:MAG TPA: hypothetical protein DD379_01840 [Cyanobacteria bacterium UBA11162]|nr:hypothetical protein [Cyanobacteria bacterium UBA11162]
MLKKFDNYATGYALICCDYDNDLWSILEVLPINRSKKRTYKVHLTVKGFDVAIDRFYSLTKQYHKESRSPSETQLLFSTQKEPL